MNPKPLISVIVPVYKTEKFLPQCIESILAQTYKNLEIILIDDGSPDNSGAICDKYAAQDKRMRVIHQANAGVSAARNAGLKIAKGEYIGFVDSDDYIAPDMYEYLYELIIRENADVAMCNFHEERAGKWNVRKQLARQEQTFVSKEVFNLYTWSYLLNKLYKNSILQDIYFNENISFGEDGIFQFQILRQNFHAAVSDLPKYYYRDNLAGATRTFHQKHLSHLEHCQQYLSYAKRYQLADFYMHTHDAYLECISAWLGWLALEENPNPEAIKILLSHCKRNLWELLRHKDLKLTKKCFLITACLNFNLASSLAKKLYRKGKTK